MSPGRVRRGRRCARGGEAVSWRGACMHSGESPAGAGDRSVGGAAMEPRFNAVLITLAAITLLLLAMRGVESMT